MGFFNLFKTKAEKRAYAIGRKHERQSCKAEKNIKVKQPKQPKFTPEERLRYHHDREGNLSKHGLAWGSSGHMYSAGFNDGVSFIDNESAIRGEFGSKAAASYAKGRDKGKEAAHEYGRKTGKQLSNLKLR